MEDLKKNAWLVSIIIVLILVKFVFVPVMDWQDNLVSDIKLLEKKKQKINNVLVKSEDNTKLNSSLIGHIAQYEQLLFPFESESQFKLAQQKHLEAVISQHELVLKDIGWLTPVLVDDLNAERHAMKLSLSGQTGDAIKFLAHLESNENRIAIDKFNFSFKGITEKNLGRVNVLITAFFYADLNASSKERK